MMDIVESSNVACGLQVFWYTIVRAVHCCKPVSLRAQEDSRVSTGSPTQTRRSTPKSIIPKLRWCGTEERRSGKFKSSLFPYGKKGDCPPAHTIKHRTCSVCDAGMVGGTGGGMCTSTQGCCVSRSLPPRFFGGMKLKCSGAQHYSIPNLDDAKLRTITVFTFGAKRT